jgi:hypothetical protein
MPIEADLLAAIARAYVEPMPSIRGTPVLIAPPGR